MTDRLALLSPRQARSRATLERALAAGAEILREGDVGAFTIAEVCRRAAVANGALYKRFPTKDALLLAVQTRVLQELAAEEQGLLRGPEWDSLDPGTLVLRAVHAVTGLFERHGPLLVALMRASQHDDAVLERGAAAARAAGNEFQTLLLTRRDAFTHPDPETAVELCARLLFDSLARRIAAPPSLRSNMPANQLANELGAMFAAYLLRWEPTGPLATWSA